MPRSIERLITPDRALELVLDHVPQPRIERRDLASSLGRLLAEEISAPTPLPAFDRAMMDGVCVRLADAGRAVEVVGEVQAGGQPGATVTPGCAVEIMTGAPCPAGTEAVVPVEAVSREGTLVRLPDKIAAEQHIQRRGAICPAGTRTLTPPARLSPLAIANLASFGRREVAVFSRPRVAVITTGDELIEPGGTLRAGTIHDANGPMLAAMAREAGAEEVSSLHAGDSEESLLEALRHASAADVIVLSGGVSMGRYDLVPAVVEGLGFPLVFHKVTQKPGKPLLFAAEEARLLFGLPGNPRSAHFCFTRYVSPAIRRWSGLDPAPSTAQATLGRRLVYATKRTLFLPVHVEPRPDGPLIHHFDERGSADIFNIASANAYLRLEPGEGELGEGTTQTIEWNRHDAEPLP